MRTRRAFTLIELLIVVAIIAILAAIAVPNFLESQVRAKVSRAYNDMRTLRVGLESYFVDYNHYIADLFGLGMYTTWTQLTTPIAYVPSIPFSPFEFNDYEKSGYNEFSKPVYDYSNTEGRRDIRNNTSIGYMIVCAGPDRDVDFEWDILALDANETPEMVYDATNGTKSSGDLLASNKEMYGAK